MLKNFLGLVLLAGLLFGCYNSNLNYTNPEDSESLNNSSEIINGVRGTVKIPGMKDASNCLVIIERQIDGIRTAAVYETTNRGISDYDLLFNSIFSVYTDKNGVFEVTGMPEGTYTVTVKKENTLGAVVKDVVVKNDRAIVDLDIVLTATGRITGRVTLSDMTSDMYGSFVYAEGTSYIAATDETGDFCIKSIPIGTYNIVFYHEGYNTYIMNNFTVTAAVDNSAGTMELSKISKNVYLSALTISNGVLSPAFDKNITYYDVTVDASVDTVTFTPSSENSNSIIKINGVVVESGGATGNLNINIGKNIFSIDVISENGEVRNYVVVVEKIITTVYTVTFETNGGSAVDNQNIVSGNKIVIPENPTKLGYSFASWYIDSALKNEWLFNVYTVTDNITLYAEWTANQYSVTFDKQSGSGGTNSVTATYDMEMPTAINPARTGYTFSGYWDSTSDGNQYYNSSMESVRNWDKTANTTLYARWIDTVPQWARSVTTGSSSSKFNSVSVDSSGNIYAVGFQYGTGNCTYGDGVSVAGTYTGKNVVIVKYNSFGVAQWARSVIAGSGTSEFKSVSVDSSGNIFAVGFQYGTGSYTYGSGVSVAGTHAGENVVIVKYNSFGVAQWARSVTAGSIYSEFKSVSVDSSGDILAVGYQWGTGSYTYGSGVSVTGTYGANNVVIVKYNSFGVAQWARSVTAGSNISEFYSVATDASDNIYTVGYQYGTGSYTYGSGVSVAGTYTGKNVVIVKYNSFGVAQWARSVIAGSGTSEFKSVSVDSSGNIFAVGYQVGTDSYTYGDAVSVAGTSWGSSNVVIVKYNSSGVAQWARSVTEGDSASLFNSVSFDSSGNIYAVGFQYGTGSYTYGSGVSVAGTYAGENVVIVKYNSLGVAQWARSVTEGSCDSEFYSVVVDASDNIYTVGDQWGSGSFDYGTSVSAAGTSISNNVIIVKYKE